jgi:hypothetical protein
MVELGVDDFAIARLMNVRLELTFDGRRLGLPEECSRHCSRLEARTAQ